MSSKTSKSKRKEERIQQLKKELAKAKNKLNDQSRSVRLDDEQLNDFLNQLTESIEWSTNRIVEESKPTFYHWESRLKKNDAVSNIIRIILGFLFICFGILGYIFMLICLTVGK